MDGDLLLSMSIHNVYHEKASEVPGGKGHHVSILEEAECTAGEVAELGKLSPAYA